LGFTSAALLALAGLADTLGVLLASALDSGLAATLAAGPTGFVLRAVDDSAAVTIAPFFGVFFRFVIEFSSLGFTVYTVYTDSATLTKTDRCGASHETKVVMVQREVQVKQAVLQSWFAISAMTG
jgi:hypothetical protein